ncbi:pentapeptide repeat-containing protein [Escherichia albertii]|uniref:pentapeptide repeat-containing protein n=1 Tax=Escherichia albertii TaxID=208962 RepID=UPI00072034EA|nr:pentapeptide repeat-containing protein [Escherichia albertii]EFF0803561.1 pentapeptide repeat-containing protein [Escherichia albertii]MCU7304450.1 pentapeptide repeat-containing protein [Escherichia albertii]MCZ8762297.1 pentapeptide repeat-containing protein [Escherichia albertii]MCZ9167423.1 pentapeptide repeat-containing protein [Escherichia albertii]WDC02273.1 pentapeptide repeat-containing protein [Escherichia albertii]
MPVNTISNPPHINNLWADTTSSTKRNDTAYKQHPYTGNPEPQPFFLTITPQSDIYQMVQGYSQREYSEVLEQLVQAVTCWPPERHSHLPPATLKTLSQINNIDFKTGRTSLILFITVIIEPEINRPIKANIFFENGNNNTCRIQIVDSSNIIALWREPLTSEISNIKDIYLKLVKLYTIYSNNSNRYYIVQDFNFDSVNMNGLDLAGFNLNNSTLYIEDLLNVNLKNTNMCNTIFLYKNKNNYHDQKYNSTYFKDQIDGLFSTLLTVSDSYDVAKSMIATQIIHYLDILTAMLNYKDLKKYKNEFERSPYQVCDKIQEWIEMTEAEFNEIKFGPLKDGSNLLPPRPRHEQNTNNNTTTLHFINGEKINLHNIFAQILP